MRLTIIALSALAANVIVFPAHAQGDPCVTQAAPVVVPATRAVARRAVVRRAVARPVGAARAHARPAAKRIKRAVAVPPSMDRIICGERPPVVEVVLPGPSVSRVPQVLPGMPGTFSRIPTTYSPMPFYAVPIAFAAPVAFTGPAWSRGLGFGHPDQSNDLVTFPPNGTPAVPGVPVWAPPVDVPVADVSVVVSPGESTPVPITGTKALMFAGLMAMWRVMRRRREGGHGGSIEGSEQ